jgi:hypothetical protein
MYAVQRVGGVGAGVKARGGEGVIVLERRLFGGSRSRNRGCWHRNRDGVGGCSFRDLRREDE